MSEADLTLPRLLCKRLLLVALLLLQATCSDVNAPNDVTLNIRLETLSTPEIAKGADPRISCTASLEATVTGSNVKQRIDWGVATARFFYGIGRDTVDGTLAISSEEVSTEWGGPIMVGGVKKSVWTFSAFAPYTLAFDFAYTLALPTAGAQADTVRHASVRVDCGPRVPAGTAPPTVTGIGMQSETLEPGSELGIWFNAASDAGLWITGLVLDGEGCRLDVLHAEALATSVFRDFHLPVPAECQVNAPLVIVVFALDPGLQSTAFARAFNLVDVTPPTLDFTFLTHDVPQPNRIQGTFFTGDSIGFAFHVTDNLGLKSIAWELPGVGYRDSMLLSGKDFVGSRWIRALPGWVGSQTMKLTVTDGFGLTKTYTSVPGQLTFYPTTTPSITSSTVAGDIDEILIDQKRNVLYLQQGSLNQIAVVSATTLGPVAAIGLPSSPSSSDLTPGGDSLLVALPASGGFAVIDLRSMPPTVQVVPLASLDGAISQRPRMLRTASNGLAFVSLQGTTSAANRLVEVNLTTGAQRFRSDAGNAGNVGGGLLGRSGDFSKVLLNGGANLLQKYDAGTDAFGPLKPSHRYDRVPVSDRTGQRTNLAWYVYDQNLDFAVGVESPYSDVYAGEFTPDGGLLYHAVSTSVMRSRGSDGKLVDRFESPFPAAVLRISSDGTMMFVAERRADSAPRGIARVSF